MNEQRAGMVLRAIVVAALGFSWLVIAQRYWCDDSFISFRFARNLVHGLGLVYNPGERVEGYTNFLWTLIAAIPQVFGRSPIHFVQILSLLANAMTLGLVWDLGRARHEPGRALLAPLLLAAQVSFLAYPMTGMETSLFAMIIVLAFRMLERASYRTAGGGVALGLVLLTLMLVRFDGFVFVALLLSWPVLGKRTVKPLLPAVAVAAVGVAAYHAWRLSYYPTPLPNTFYAKTSFSPTRMAEGAGYVLSFFREWRFPLLLLGAIAVLGKGGRATWSAAWTAAGLIAYPVLVGGDWMPLHRFLLPALPFLALLAQDGFWGAWDALRPVGRRGAFATGLLIATLTGAGLLTVYEHRQFGELTARHFQLRDAARIGTFLDTELPPDALVSIEWGGIIPFHARQRFLETFGLADREIVEDDDTTPTIWGRRLSPEYLARRHPDVVVTCAKLFPSERAALRATEPGGPADYGYYMELVRQNLGYRVKVFQVGEKAFWPGLVPAGTGD